MATAAQTKSPWVSVSIHPLTTLLDTRSRPSDLVPGAFRWKTNFQSTVEGKLCRRAGFDHAFSELTGPNFDHHHVGSGRQPKQLLFEATDPTGNRFLYDASSKMISILDESAGLWNDIATGQGPSSSYWKAAMLQGRILFTNNVNPILMGNIGDQTPNSLTTIPELVARGVSAAKVVVQFSGFILLMNVVQTGVRYTSKIVWCDLNDPTAWNLATPQTLAGFQDLDYGDEILAAMELLGSLYIFTRRNIWKVGVAASQNQTFSFTRVYSEPKNEAGMLVYENTLVSVGDYFYYMSRDGIYRFGPYVAQPEREDWLHKASGVIFKKTGTSMAGVLCQAPVADYTPSTKELWFSWPAGANLVNTMTMVASIEQKTADIIERGFTAFANYRKTQFTAGQCNEVQTFLGASGEDYSIKQFGGVFYHELVVIGETIIEDIPLVATYHIVGYNSILRGMIPLGFTDREKLVRQALIDADVAEQAVPCVVRCRIGNSQKINDPNDIDDVCAVMWRDLGTKPLKCPDDQTISKMQKHGLRPSNDLQFPCYEGATFLYFEFTIQNKDGTPAIGCDACIERLDFDAFAKPKT